VFRLWHDICLAVEVKGEKQMVDAHNSSFPDMHDLVQQMDGSAGLPVRQSAFARGLEP
jgi:hypothetical protein